MSEAPDVLDPKQTHVVHEWKYSSPLIACRFSPDGRFLVTSAQDSTAQRWEFPSGAQTTYDAHDSWVLDVGFLPERDELITVGADDKMIFWPAAGESPKPRKVVEAHRGWIRTVSVSPTGRRIATGGNDNRVRIWDPADASLVAELSGHEDNVYSTLFHPDGERLLSGDLGGKVHEWNLADGKLERTFDAKDLHSYNSGQKVHYGGVRDMAFTADGRHLACSGLHKATNPLAGVNEPIVVLFNWETGEPVRTLLSDGLTGIAERVVYLSDGTLLGACGGRGGAILMFWRGEEEQTFHTFKLPDVARGIDLHPDGLHVATAHYDAKVRISRMTAKADAGDKNDATNDGKTAG